MNEALYCATIDSSTGLFSASLLRSVPDLIFYSFVPAIIFTAFIFIISFIKRKSISDSFLISTTSGFSCLILIIFILMWFIVPHNAIQVLWKTDYLLEVLYPFAFLYFSYKYLDVSKIYILKFFNTVAFSLSVVLIVFSQSSFVMSGYSYTTCESILGPFWWLLILLQVLVSVLVSASAIKTLNSRARILTVLFSALPLLILAFTNISFFVFDNWFNDIYFSVASIFFCFGLFAVNKDLQSVVFNPKIFYWMILTFITSFGASLYTVISLKEYRLLAILSILVYMAIFALIFGLWKSSKILRQKNTRLIEQQKNLLRVVSSVSHEGLTTFSGKDFAVDLVDDNKVYNRLAEAINNIMLSVPGGKYRKLEFAPHSVDQIVHVLGMLGPVRSIQNRVDDVKVLVDIGFLTELITVLIGKSDVDIHVRADSGAIRVGWKSDIKKTFDDSEQKMARLMSVSLDIVDDSVQLVIPVLSEVNTDDSEE